MASMTHTQREVWLQRGERIPGLGVEALKAMAIDLGIKTQGVGWPRCCPPTAAKADIAKAIRAKMQTIAEGGAVGLEQVGDVDTGDGGGVEPGSDPKRVRRPVLRVAVGGDQQAHGLQGPPAACPPVSPPATAIARVPVELLVRIFELVDAKTLLIVIPSVIGNPPPPL